MKKERDVIDPVRVTPHAWYYVEPTGVSYVQEDYRDQQLVKTNVVTIPWRVLRQIMKRRARTHE